MEPGFVMTRYRLGLALEALGRYDEAIGEFEAMQPLARGPAGSHRHRAHAARSWGSSR